MNWKTKAVVLVLIIGAVAGVLFLSRHHSQPGLILTLRFSVTPSEKSEFVIAEANSAKFKYLVGKKSNLKPLLAQKLSVTRVPNSSFIQATLHVPGQSEAQRYEAAFLQTLQEQCGGQA